MYNFSILYNEGVFKVTRQEVEEKFRQSLKQEHKIIDSGFKVDELVIKLELNSQEYESILLIAVFYLFLKTMM